MKTSACVIALTLGLLTGCGEKLSGTDPVDGGGGDLTRIELDCDERPQSSDAVKVLHHDGQTFVTWTDQAEGDAGVAYRYDVYRSEQPITDANLAQTTRIAKGVLNNSGKLFGQAFYPKDRVDSTLPMTVIEQDGGALPMWSGLQVHTATKDACAYYAVVPTTVDGMPTATIMPGMNATTVAVAERVNPMKPIELYTSDQRMGPYIPQTRVTGTPNLPLQVLLHASSSAGGGAGDYGDYFLYYADTTMGYVDGLPGVYSVEETHSGPQTLMMRNRDTIVNPTGAGGGIETYWFGYACVPQWADPATPIRAYPFTERRLMWMIDQVLTRYQVDREHVTCTGGSMGAWGTMAFGIRHPELFAALYADRPRTRQTGLPALVTVDKTTTLMEDGTTLYLDRMDSVKYATEHKEDLPFILWGVGRNDGFASWQEEIDFAKAMTDAHHGFVFAWNNGDHSTGTAALAMLADAYPASKFARNLSYPALGHSSIDNNVGNGDPTNGDLEGGMNLGFDWTVTTDEDGKWETSLSNKIATAMMTVDVTPRRCQKWKPTPGSMVSYTTSTGQSGSVMADAAGLATITAVQIAPGAATVITLTK